MGLCQGDSLASLLYVASTDIILDILEKKYQVEIVAYADDILIGIDDDVDHSVVIDEVQSLFSHIGLTVNKDKCKCTKTEIVQFMGFKFSNNRDEEMALAPELLEKDQKYLISKLKEYDTH